ncbi:hypothetical protein [Oceanicella actignis]|nr:hypothetical protein [Oceanicella actignis]
MAILTGVVLMVALGAIAQKSETLMAAFSGKSGPSPVDDVAELRAGGSYVIDVLHNDEGIPDPSAVALKVVSPPVCGRLRPEGGMLVYDVPAICAGTQTAVYCVEQDGACARATLTLALVDSDPRIAPVKPREAPGAAPPAAPERVARADSARPAAGAPALPEDPADIAAAASSAQGGALPTVAAIAPPREEPPRRRDLQAPAPEPGMVLATPALSAPGGAAPGAAPGAGLLAELAPRSPAPAASAESARPAPPAPAAAPARPAADGAAPAAPSAAAQGAPRAAAPAALAEVARPGATEPRMPPAAQQRIAALAPAPAAEGPAQPGPFGAPARVSAPAAAALPAAAPAPATHSQAAPPPAVAGAAQMGLAPAMARGLVAFPDAMGAVAMRADPPAPPPAARQEGRPGASEPDAVEPLFGPLLALEGAAPQMPVPQGEAELGRLIGPRGPDAQLARAAARPFMPMITDMRPPKPTPERAEPLPQALASAGAAPAPAPSAALAQAEPEAAPAAGLLSRIARLVTGAEPVAAPPADRRATPVPAPAQAAVALAQASALPAPAAPAPGWAPPQGAPVRMAALDGSAAPSAPGAPASHDRAPLAPAPDAAPAPVQSGATPAPVQSGPAPAALAPRAPADGASAPAAPQAVERAPQAVAALDARAAQAPAAIPPASAPDCPVALSARAEPGAFVHVEGDSSCRAGRVGVLEHEGLRFAVRFDAKGRFAAELPAFARDARVSYVEGGAALAQARARLLDAARVLRVALVWDAPVDLNLHAFEFGASVGAPGHVWERAPGDARAYRRGRGGLTQSFPSLEGQGDNIEVYSFNPGRRSPQGVIRMAVEFASRGRLAQPPYCGLTPEASPVFRTVRLENGRVEERSNQSIVAASCGEAIADAALYLPDMVRDMVIVHN